MIQEPGIFVDYDPAEYYRDPCPTPSLSQSLVKTLLDRSPAHAWLEHPRNPSFDPGKPTYAAEKAIGNAWHLLLLERGKKLRLLQHDNMLSTKAKDERNAAWAVGEEPVLEKHFHVALAMSGVALDRLRNDFGIELVPSRGDSEVVLAWREQSPFTDTEIWMRSLVDFLSTDRRQVIDLKSTGLSCAPQSIPNKMLSDGFVIQAAFHGRGLDILDPSTAGRRKHLFILQENTPPYAMSVIRMSEPAMTIGRKMVDFAVRKWTKCRTEEQWPAYPTLIHEPDLPSYAVDAWLRREEEEMLQ